MNNISARLRFFSILTAIVIFSFTETANAFGIEDRNLIYERGHLLVRSNNLRGRRQGFIFGFGAGVGNTSFTAPLAVYWGNTYDGKFPDPRERVSSFATEFKLGHGLSDQFLLYYTSRITWLPLSNLYRDTMVANGSAGVGMMIYPLRSSDIYVVTSAGLAVLVTWNPSFKLERARQTGLTVSAGLGYEILPHLTIDFTANFGNAKPTQLDDVNEITLSREITTYLVTLNLLIY